MHVLCSGALVAAAVSERERAAHTGDALLDCDRVCVCCVCCALCAVRHHRRWRRRVSTSAPLARCVTRAMCCSQAAWAAWCSEPSQVGVVARGGLLTAAAAACFAVWVPVGVGLPALEGREGGLGLEKRFVVPSQTARQAGRLAACQGLCGSAVVWRAC